MPDIIIDITMIVLCLSLAFMAVAAAVSMLKDGD